MTDRNWDPAQHPRDPRDGQFTESWVGAVSAAIDQTEADRARRAIAAQRETHGTPESHTELMLTLMRPMNYMVNIVGISGVSEFEAPVQKAREWRSNADDILVWESLGSFLEPDQLSAVHQVRDAADVRIKQWEATPPWEGGPPDWEGKHYEAWVKQVRSLIEERGFDPDAEIVKNEIPWDDDSLESSSYYHSMMNEIPGRLIQIEMDNFEEEVSEDLLQPAYNAVGIFNHAMDAEGHPEAKEINLHLLAAHPDFASSGRFEIYNPEVDDWALLEDQDWNERDEVMTIWAGDWNYEIDIDDDAPILRRVT